jgi:cation diffusion facilitator family transporter
MNSHPALPAEEAAALTRQVTLLSVITAAVLVAMKLAVWLVSGSVALMASLADSGLDLIASLATFFAVRYAAAPPDAEHRFGHGKAEAFASLFQGGLVFASAALVGREAIVDLLAPHPLKAEGWAIGVMALSTLLTGGLIAAQTRVLNRTGSVAVSGDRAHYASDLGSNLIALAGIAASAWFGVGGLDAVAALLVAAVLLWGAIGVFREAANQLLDRELGQEARGRIVELISRDARITGVHQLRTRAAGPYVHMQMHIDLDPELTLADAHEVLVDAEKRVLEDFPSADIIMHADPRGKAEPHGGAFAETARANA